MVEQSNYFYFLFIHQLIDLFALCQQTQLIRSKTMVHTDHMDLLICSQLGHLEFAWFLTSDLHIKCTSTTKTYVLKDFVLPSVSAFFEIIDFSC